METGHRRVRDVQELRQLANALGIPLGMVGLTQPPGGGKTAGIPRPATDTPTAQTEDEMRRRDMLTGLVVAPLAVSTLPAAAAGGTAPVAAGPGERLLAAVRTAVLYPGAGQGTGDPATLGGDLQGLIGQARRQLAACMRAFQGSDYARMADQLPRLMHAAAALPPTGDAAAVRAEIQNTLTRVLIKFEVPGLGWLSADRAMADARASGDPAVIASCTRSMVSLCRRSGHYSDAQDLALQACGKLTTTGASPDPVHLSLTGMLLGNAAYAAAQAGDRSRSTELLDLADQAAARLGSNRNEQWTAFGPTNVTLHRISAAHALGDAGAAIAHARTVAPTDLRLPERRSRFWVDVARAYHLAGQPASSLRALLIAERNAPQEVRARPAVRDLARALLTAPGRHPGLRDLAHRVNAAV